MDEIGSYSTRPVCRSNGRTPRSVVTSSIEAITVDVIARIGIGTTVQAFYRYYGKRVASSTTQSSSISISQYARFGSRTHEGSTSSCLEMSERLVNSLNDRSRHDLIHFC